MIQRAFSNVPTGRGPPGGARKQRSPSPIWAQIQIVPPLRFLNDSGYVCESSNRGYKPGIPFPPVWLVMTDKQN